jgi:hypothetical protein
MTVMATQIQTSSTATSKTVSRASPKLHVVASSRVPPFLVVVERSAPRIASTSQGACRTG